MTVLLSSGPVVDADTRYCWSRAAAQAACRVPADEREAENWTVRGWSEVALGCVVLGGEAAFQGLDEVVRASGVPCSGPYAARLHALRRLGGGLPGCYLSAPPATDPSTPRPLPGPVARACAALATYCDSLDTALLRQSGRGEQGVQTPSWATTVDHLRWGERFRVPVAARRWYCVVSTPVPAQLVRRAWLRLPSADMRHPVLVRPSGAVEATVRQRVRQGLHNGAHLDHLAALADDEAAAPWSPSAIEFGAGLLVAEAYAMSIELLASAQCAITGRPAEARELYWGLVSRIGRIPGFAAWHARHPASSPALRRAAAQRSAEFAALPTLAAQYVTGPLRLIAEGWIHPLIPSALARRVRARWAEVCEKFEPAAALSAVEGSAETPWPGDSAAA